MTAATVQQSGAVSAAATPTAGAKRPRLLRWLVHLVVIVFIALWFMPILALLVFGRSLSDLSPLQIAQRRAGEFLGQGLQQCDDPRAFEIGPHVGADTTLAATQHPDGFW